MPTVLLKPVFLWNLHKGLSSQPPPEELGPVLANISSALQLQDPLTVSKYNDMDSCAPTTEELSANWCQELLSNHFASMDERASGDIADEAEEEEEVTAS